MASVIINEKDYTESTAYEPTDTIVYIPGMPGEDCADASSLVNTPTLFSSVEDFVGALGTKPKILSGTEETMVTSCDKSYVMAKQLLALGVKVLYEVVAQDENNLTVPASTKSELLNRLSSSSHWAKLYDRALYNPRFLTSGGYESIWSYSGLDSEGQEYKAYNTSIALNMLECAHFTAAQDGINHIGRGDCVALIDHVIDLTDVDDIAELFNQGLSNIQDLGTFGSAFTPWCSHSLTVDTGYISPDDQIAGTWALPGSFTYLAAYATAIASSPTWYAAAGVTRGASPTLVKPLVEFGERAAASLQSREDGFIAINPVCKIVPYGYRVYGNRTLRQNGLNNKSDLVATSFLNIRNLVSDIKKTSFAACRRMAFEQNTDVLWTNLKAQIVPLLDRMQTGNGIEGYKMIRVPTQKKATVIGRIRIIPIEAVEDFILTVELTDSLEIETESE